MPTPYLSQNLCLNRTQNKNDRSHKHKTLFNVMSFTIVAALLIALAIFFQEANEPIANLAAQHPITLNPINLFQYSLYSVYRMVIALFCSFLFSLAYGAIAAKNNRAEQIMVPLLDILQSVPILGYISFTITIFLKLFPGSVIGAECAAIFALFTSQVWNMTFSFYQSIKMLPEDLSQASQIFKMSSWQKFWRVEVPYALPNLIWNISVSMSSGWFFIVAAEVIVVGNTSITLPGIGSYISLALNEQNISAVIYAITAMIITIILYDQLLIRTLVVWANKFRYETTTSSEQNRQTSLIFNVFHNSSLMQTLFIPLKYLAHIMLNLSILNKPIQTQHHPKNESHFLNYLWNIILLSIFFVSIYYLLHFLIKWVSVKETLDVIRLAIITLCRICIMIFLAVIIWVPIGVFIGLHAKLSLAIMPLAQFLAAFPANIFFPIAVILISKYNLTPDIWLSPLVIIGAQWYILFNVIAGTKAMPNDLKEVVQNLNIKGILWWKKIMLPIITPSLLTGIITATGGAWNATIVSEIIYYGDKKIIAHGIGSYIAQMTTEGNLYNVTLGILIMSLFVVLINRLIWKPLQSLVIKNFQLL